MIDTIVLMLTKEQYTITKPELFSPSALWVLADSDGVRGVQSKQNPTKKEFSMGFYKPRLTLFKQQTRFGGYKKVLKIELSLPKLLFGNNFDELQRKDFLPLVKKLVSILQSMGVKTTASMLAQAPISVIHYAKNIPLTDGSTPYHYINKIKEANIKLSLDVNQTDYRNDGHCYKWHCNSYELVFYDKIRDLEKARTSNKRAVEKDTTLQMYLFNALQERKKLEILRMEIRLNKRTKIKQLFKKLGIISDLTFKNLFKPTIARKILLYYLDEIESKRPMLLDFKTPTDKALLVALLFNNPKLGPRRIMQLYGLKQALKTVTCRELRTMFANYNKRTWYRLMADAKNVKLPATPRPFGVIRDCLIGFKPIKLAQFKDGLNHSHNNKSLSW